MGCSSFWVRMDLIRNAQPNKVHLVDTCPGFVDVIRGADLEPLLPQLGKHVVTANGTFNGSPD